MATANEMTRHYHLLRYVRFSLASLMIAVTIVAVAVAVKAHRIRQYRNAVDAVHRLSGRVWHYHECDSRGTPITSFAGETSSPAGRWQGFNSMWNQRVTTIVCIDLRHSVVTDEDIHIVLAFPMLRQLYLDHTAVSDQGIAQLRVLGRLEIIGIDGTSVSEDGVSELQRHVPGMTTNRDFKLEAFSRFLEETVGGDRAKSKWPEGLLIDP